MKTIIMLAITAAGSNWTLTGLNLPTGQNIYIRAHGYYRSGQYSGSESITESVRNAFLAVPALTSHADPNTRTESKRNTDASPTGSPILSFID